MSDSPGWLPDLIRLSDYNGDWSQYIEAVYAIFRRDFIDSQPQLRGKRVGCRHHPIDDGKEFSFWHCVSEGNVEEDRTPDLRRCERIPWMRPIIENETDGTVASWQINKRRDRRQYLWFNEEYLIVLGVRRNHYILITAFPTDREHTRRRLRRERDRAIP